MTAVPKRGRNAVADRKAFVVGLLKKVHRRLGVFNRIQRFKERLVFLVLEFVDKFNVFLLQKGRVLEHDPA